MQSRDDIDFSALAATLKQWGLELGFDAVGITDTELTEAESHLHNWLSKDFHGEMSWMHSQIGRAHV